MAKLAAEELLTMNDIAERLGVAAVTIRKYRSEGRMPEPTALLPGSTGWPVPVWAESTIKTWVASRPGPHRFRSKAEVKQLQRTAARIKAVTK